MTLTHKKLEQIHIPSHKVIPQCWKQFTDPVFELHKVILQLISNHYHIFP